MDGISVASSIVGITVVAAKLVPVLRNFWLSMKDVPTLVQNVISEISGISACLGQLQSFLHDTSLIPRPRAGLVMVEQILVSLTECVAVFSELERVIDSTCKANGDMSMIDRARWLSKQDIISRILVRLQAAKLTLSLMLSTLTR